MKRRGFLQALMATPVVAQATLTPQPLTIAAAPPRASDGRLYITAERAHATGDLVAAGGFMLGVALHSVRAGEILTVQTYGPCKVRVSGN